MLQKGRKEEGGKVGRREENEENDESKYRKYEKEEGKKGKPEERRGKEGINEERGEVRRREGRGGGNTAWQDSSPTCYHVTRSFVTRQAEWAGWAGVLACVEGVNGRV